MVNDELENQILSKIGLDHKSLNEGVAHLLQWLSKQPHLPNAIDEDLLRGFIVGSKSVERAKHKLDTYFTMKGKLHELFSEENRDPRKIRLEIMQRVIVWKTLDGHSVMHIKIPDTKESIEAFTAADMIKLIFMMDEILLKNSPITAGQIVFADAQGLTMEFFTKCLVSIVPTSIQFYENALPTRMKCFVIYNSSPLAETFVNKILKVFLSPKLADRIRVHTEDHTILPKYCSPDVIPKEIGGNGPSYAQHIDENSMELEKERDWLMTEGALKANEGLRPLPESDWQSIRGSFRKLEVD